jgi:hypothetical protein
MPGFGTSLLVAMPKCTAQVIGGRKDEATARLARGERKHGKRGMM